MDWLDTTRQDRFAYEMIDPRDMKSSRGWLSNVSSASISEAYETDLKVSGKLEAVDSGYISGSLVRIHHYVDAWRCHNILGTFFVTKHDPKASAGANVESFTLSSMLERINEDYFEANYAFGTDTGSAIISRMLTSWNVAFEISPDCTDTTKVGATVYAAGTKKLKALQEISASMGAIIALKGDGTVYLHKYTDPATKTPLWTITDRNGTIAGDITITEPSNESYNRALLTYKSGNADWSAHADIPSSNPLSYAQTGRVKAKVINITELNPQTGAQLRSLAQIYANELVSAKRKYGFNMLYLPMSCGDVCTIGMSGKNANAMLVTRDIDLCAGMPCAVTFKEV